MKKVYCIISILIVGTAPLAFINCDLEEQETLVRGQVYDSAKQKMLEGAKVAIWKCQTSFSSTGLSCIDIEDSTRTNEQGRYLFKFLTDKYTDEYHVRIEPDGSFYSLEEHKIRAGTENFITIYATELNYIRVHMQIEHNTLGPIFMETAFGNEVAIPQHTRDTVVFGRVVPNTQRHSIIFRAYDKANGNNTRVSTDELDIGLSDTVYFTKTIIDPALWEIP